MSTKLNIARLPTLALLALFTSCGPDEEIIIETSQVSVSASSRSASEEGINGVFTLRLAERLSTDLEISFELDGSATNGIDYEQVSPTIVIPADELSAKVTITPVSDLDEEGDENIALTILTTSNSNVTLDVTKSASLILLDGPSAEDLVRDETRIFMSNPQATDETVSLFYNLRALPETGFIVGQQDAFGSFFNNASGDSDVKKGTGSDPGLLGSDFLFITDDENDGSSSNWFFQQEQKIKNHALDAYEKGMVNTFSWHMLEPYEGDHFYTWEMTDFQKNNAFRSILPGGENHAYYKRKLEKIAEVVTSMIGQNGEPIPIILRPFHEFDGDWFWWGAPYSTPQEFITLWRFTVDYLVRDLNVNNLLFAFSPDNNYTTQEGYLERYPGDAYVDILGMDNYGDFNNNGQMGLDDANRKLKVISDLAKAKGKIAALTESCFFIRPGEVAPIPGFYANNLYNALTQNDVEVSFMMFWSNNRDQYCTPPPSELGFEDFMDFINKPSTLLADELPAMYRITIIPDS